MCQPLGRPAFILNVKSIKEELWINLYLHIEPSRLFCFVRESELERKKLNFHYDPPFVLLNLIPTRTRVATREIKSSKGEKLPLAVIGGLEA